MIYSHIIRILGGYNCFLLCSKSSGLCTLYQLKRMSFLVKQIKCEQHKCEAANQNCTYKLSCGIDVRQDITGNKKAQSYSCTIQLSSLSLSIQGVMVFNATFSNISVLSLGPVLLVEETGVLREKHQPAAIKTQIEILESQIMY